MNAYMVYDRQVGPREAAVLAFAHSVKEARKVSWPVAGDWCEDWISLAARRLDHEPWLFDQADKEKLAAEIPHVIESPTPCKCCETWGHDLDDRGLCEDCAEEEEGCDD